MIIYKAIYRGDFTPIYNWIRGPPDVGLSSFIPDDIFKGPMIW